MRENFILKLSEIGFYRGKNEILSGISCQINPHEHMALIGPNGSGKTSLIKIIAGIEWPVSGTVEFYGKPRLEFDFRELRKHISLVSQAGKKLVNGWQKGIDVVTAGIDSSYNLYREYSKQEIERAYQLLEHFNCLDCAEKTFDILSEGQQQRIMIARAMINDPAIIILDEPCNGLDPAGRGRLSEDIAALAAKEESPTIIYVTHYMEEVYPYITTVLALKNGKQFSYGNAESLMNNQALNSLFDTNIEYRLNFS